MLWHFPIVNLIFRLHFHINAKQHAVYDNCVNLISERLIAGDELRKFLEASNWCTYKNGGWKLMKTG